MKALGILLLMCCVAIASHGQTGGFGNGPHPLDASGEWEACPAPPSFAFPTLPERTRHRLSLRYTGKGVTNNVWYFHYVGELEYFNSLHVTTHPECLRDDRSFWTYFSYSFKYDVDLMMMWSQNWETGRLEYNGLSGTGRRQPGPYPRFHSLGQDISLQTFNYIYTRVPAENESEARLYMVVGHSNYPTNSTDGRDPCFLGAIHVPKHGLDSYQRKGPPPSDNVTGKISVKVNSAVTTLTEDPEVVHRATVRVYRQEGFIRNRLNGESDAAYQTYLEEAKKQNRQVGTAQISPGNSRVEFAQLQALERAEDGGARLARYTIEVSEGETDEWFMDRDGNVDTNKTETLYFVTQEMRNVHVDSGELNILLNPFGTLGAKKDLIAKLSELGPYHFAPAENRALDHIWKLESGQLEMTAGRDEGVRRAVWAERVVRDQAVFAEEMTELILQGFGNVLGDLYSDLSDFRGVQAKEAERLVKSREKVNAEVAARYRLDAKDLEQNAELNKAVQGAFDHEAAEALLMKAKIATMVQKVMKALKPHLERQLIAHKFSSSQAKAISETVVQALNIVFNRVQSLTTEGNFRDLIKLAIKEAVKLAKPVLTDIPLVSFGTTVGQTAEYLEFSVDRMQTWTAADPEQYREDREAVVLLMNEMAADWQAKLRRSTYGLALSGVADASQNLFGAAGKVLKWAKVLEKFSQVSKYTLNVGSTIEPLIFNYKDGPEYVKKGVYRAYNQEPPMAMAPMVAAALSAESGEEGINYYTGTNHVGVPSTNEVLSVLTSVVGKLGTNDLGGALIQYAGTETNFLKTKGSFLRDALYFMEHAANVDTNGQAAAVANAVQHQDELNALRTLVREFEVRFTSLVEGVLTGIHQTTNSALYLGERGKVVEAAQEFQRKLQEIYGGWTSLDNGTQARMFLPLVVVEPVSISSTATNSSFITRSPETFLIRARVRNLSGNAVTNFQAVLHVGGRTNGIANLAELFVPKVLNLESKDGSTGSGTDEAMLEWELDYAGALIEAQIELYIEGLAAPNYAVVGTEMGLHVDAGIYDGDADGLLDDWEGLHGLSITENDAALDSDGDGVSNENEFRIGTAPKNSDTDGDGLSDGMEIAGAMGFKTNARLKDSDSDGTFDNLDGAPNDAASATETFLFDEPTVEVGTRTVILTRNRPFAFVEIRNAGEGELFWSATVSNPNLVTTSGSSSPQLNTDSVLISVSSSFDFNAADVAVSTVTISDNAGQSLDAQQITVIITGGFNSETALSVGVDEGTFRLSWAAVAGQTYLVQYSENLNTWTTAADGTFVADRDGVLRWTDSGPPGTTSPPAGALQRFYRVTTAPQE